MTTRAEMQELFDVPHQDGLFINGHLVRSIGAYAAEQLARFVIWSRSEGVSVTVEASADMVDDLRIIGLDKLVLEEEAAQ